jgi:hypothetical protein
MECRNWKKERNQMWTGAAELYLRAERLREEYAKSLGRLGGSTENFWWIECSGTFG